MIDLTEKKLMTKFFDKLKKNHFWPNLGQFSLLCRTQCGFLTPCQNLEKTNDPIPRKCSYRETDRRKDGQADKPFFIGSFRLLLRV